ncbi:hypothetical protein [Alishewanella longhuensis]
MSTIHSTLLYLHILLGAVCLLLFWLPVISTKGSKLHSTSGRVYYQMMLFIAASGAIMSTLVLIDPVAVYASANPLPTDKVAQFQAERRHFSSFLLLLSVLTWVTVRHAYAVLHAKSTRQQLKHWQLQLPVLLLLLGSFYMLWSGWQSGTNLFMIFSIVGIFTALGIWRYVWQKQLAQRQWIIEHFSSMIASGIALYTAFFAAGGRRMLAGIITGHWQIVSWLIAPILGVVAIALFKRHFEKKFRVTNSHQ